MKIQVINSSKRADNMKKRKTHYCPECNEIKPVYVSDEYIITADKNAEFIYRFKCKSCKAEYARIGYFDTTKDELVGIQSGLTYTRVELLANGTSKWISHIKKNQTDEFYMTNDTI